MKVLLWRYRYRFAVAGQAVTITTRTYATRWDTEVLVDGAISATTGSSYFAPAGLANHHLSIRLADGRDLSIFAGYNSWWTVGAVACIGDAVVFESHPGRALAMPASLNRAMENSFGENGQAAKMRSN